MNFYRAKEQDTAPFLTFEQVAGSLAELQEIGLENDPLVVDEDRLTDPTNLEFISFDHGICHKRIVNGVLEDTLPGDISAAKDNLTKALNVELTKSAAAKFESRTFGFGGKSYPMNAAAMRIYAAVIQKGADAQVMSTTGVVTLKVADLAAFEMAMNDEILLVNAELINS